MLDRLKRLFRSVLPSGAPDPRTPVERRGVQKLLTEEFAVGYKPNLPVAGFWDGSSDLPNLQQMIQDVESMLAHPRVNIALGYYKSGIANAEFEIDDASEPGVGEWGLKQLRRFWQRSRLSCQRAYDYGRNGYEVVYDVEDGLLCFDSLIDFFPLDCTVLSRDKRYCGVRVRNVANTGHLDLWGPHKVPAKGFWFGHNLRYSPWYGVPQLYAAWRPWRRLAGRDGAEEMLDGAMYRWLIKPPVGRYPLEDNQPRPAAYGQAGQPLTNRDKMREFLEMIKTGGVVAFSSRRDEHGQYVWDVDFPEHMLDPGAALEYTDNLEKLISLGIGVPPELLEASEVGSGYSGRAIPLEGYYVGQQGNAESLVAAWEAQIGLPLAKWNFGPRAWFRVKVKPLLETKLKQQGQAGGQPGAGSEQPGAEGEPEPQPAGPGGSGQMFATEFNEGEHPRGQPGNAGQFAPADKGTEGEGKGTVAYE